MVALILAWLCGYLAAKLIRIPWLRVPCAIVAGVVSSIIGTSLAYLTVGDAFTSGEIAIKLVTGVLLYPFVSLLALWVHGKHLGRGDVPRQTVGIPESTSVRAEPKTTLHALDGWLRLLIGFSALWLVFATFVIYIDYPSTDRFGFFEEGPFTFWRLAESPFETFDDGTSVSYVDPNYEAIVGFGAAPIIALWAIFLVGRWVCHGFSRLCC